MIACGLLRCSDKTSSHGAAGKKAAITRATASYTVDQHFEGKPKHVQELAQKVREFITGLNTVIEEVPLLPGSLVASKPTA
jgi:hypothetical protein